jgi:hypothetical protein
LMIALLTAVYASMLVKANRSVFIEWTNYS